MEKILLSIRASFLDWGLTKRLWVTGCSLLRNVIGHQLLAGWISSRKELVFSLNSVPSSDPLNHLADIQVISNKFHFGNIATEMAESTEMEIVAQSLPTEDPSKVTERVSISAAENSIPDVEPVTTDLE
jgi:hypothetical protein